MMNRILVLPLGKRGIQREMELIPLIVPAISMAQNQMAKWMAVPGFREECYRGVPPQQSQRDRQGR